MKIFLPLLILFIHSLAFGQNSKRQDEVQLQIEQLMKAREEMLKSLLNDSAFDNFDKKFEDLIKNFDRGNFNPSMGGGDVVGEYDWRETNTHQVFVLKVKQIKDKPLDIKIEKGQIILKGDVESSSVDPVKKTKRISKVHFERTFSIPDGVDQTSPEFENKNGELLIKFKKLMAKKTPVNDSNRVPVGPDASDVII